MASKSVHRLLATYNSSTDFRFSPLHSAMIFSRSCIDFSSAAIRASLCKKLIIKFIFLQARKVACSLALSTCHMVSALATNVGLIRQIATDFVLVFPSLILRRPRSIAATTLSLEGERESVAAAIDLGRLRIRLSLPVFAVGYNFPALTTS